MGREKKITVKPFLNTRLKSKQVAFGGAKLFPLYFQVIYDQKTTRFQAGNKWFSLSDKENLTDDPVIAGTISAIKNIIRHEAERVEGFEIKGIGERIKSYSTEMGVACKLSLIKQIEGNLRLTVQEHKEWGEKNIDDKIEAGLVHLGGTTPEDIGRLYLLSTMIDSVAPQGLTVYSWLLTDARKAIVSSIEQFVAESKGENVTVLGKGGSRFSYSYPLRVNPTIEGFDRVAHLIIDNGVHFVPDYKSVSYDEGGQVFRLEV